MKILIVDDHEVVREGMKIAVNTWNENAQVTALATAAEVHDEVLENNYYDLILLDLSLPDTSNYYLIDYIRKYMVNSYIIVLSAEERIAIVKESLKRGANGFICKTTSYEEMFHAIEKVLLGEIYISKSLRDGLFIQQEIDQNNLSTYLDMNEQKLNQKQVKIIELLNKGKSNKEIADELKMSPATVRSYLTIIFRELGVRNRTEAVMKARDHGLVID